MKYLAIDTSGSHLTVALKINEKLYTVFNENCGVLHSTALMPAVEDLLKQANATLSDVDFIACSVGAGSFTGIRIGVSTVKALCYALKKPCLGVTSFDIIAYDTIDGDALAVIDAKHGCYYAQRYAAFAPVTDAEFISGEELVSFSGGSKIACSSDIPFKYVKANLLGGFIKAVESNANKATFDYEKLTPLYIRKSQAEENR